MESESQTGKLDAIEAFKTVLCSDHFKNSCFEQDQALMVPSCVKTTVSAGKCLIVKIISWTSKIVMFRVMLLMCQPEIYWFLT